MTSSVSLHSSSRSGRRLPRTWAAALALATVVFLAACGTSDVGVPPGFDDEPTWEEQIGTAPGAIAVFAAEAESAVPDSGFDVDEDEEASGGLYLVQPSSVAASTSGAVVSEVAFELATAGSYGLWTRVYAPSLSSDATYLGFNGATVRTYAPELERYLWVHVVSEELEAGAHVISLGHGEPGLRIDLVAVVRDAAVGDAELEALVRRDPRTPRGPKPEPEPAPAPAPAPEPAPSPAPAPTVPSSRSAFSLRGDAGFTVGALSAEQRLWHERSLSATVASVSDMVSRASRDDAYYNGRDLFQWSTAVLLGLRSSGDLRFLDALDPMLQQMRSTLYDGWCDGVADSVYVNSQYGTVYGRDGFLNFRLRYDSGRDYCRDSGDLNEALVHGHLAMVMYAYHANRDLTSPAGIDYGERADFWFDYLRNHFEAKWRKRTGVAFPNMNFLDLKFAHTHHVFTLYYWFMGQRLASVGDPAAAAYLTKVDALTTAMFEVPYVPGVQTGGFVNVSAPTGDAVVYSFGSPGRRNVPSTTLEAAAMTYARYVMSAVLVLRLEGAARWEDGIMVRLSNGLTGYVIDRSSVSSTSDTLAAGVTGSGTVAGIDPTTLRGRLTVGQFGASSMAAFAVWDRAGTIERISAQTYAAMESNADRPSNPAIPTSMLFVETATLGQLGFSASR